MLNSLCSTGLRTVKGCNNRQNNIGSPRTWVTLYWTVMNMMANFAVTCNDKKTLWLLMNSLGCNAVNFTSIRGSQLNRTNASSSQFCYQQWKMKKCEEWVLQSSYSMWNSTYSHNWGLETSRSCLQGLPGVFTTTGTMTQYRCIREILLRCF